MISNNTHDFFGKKNKVKKCYYTKIEGGYLKVHSLLVENLQRRKTNTNLKSLVIFDNFDGANHLETCEGKTDLVSFSSVLTSKELLTIFSIQLLKVVVFSYGCKLLLKKSLACYYHHCKNIILCK